MINLLLVFLIGLVVGSFLNVVIIRMRELHTILAERSHCPHCKKVLKWYDLIPFLSFFLLKTRCRYCREPISWQYPIVEIATALLFTGIFWQFGNYLITYFLLLITCFLVVIFVYDLRHMLIADEILWPALIITLLLYCSIALFQKDMSIVINSLIGGAIIGGFIGLIVLVTRGKGMGIGDIKLGILLGLIVGIYGSIITLFFAFVIGSIIGIFLLLAGKARFKDAVPFAPFLIVGFYITLFYGNQIMNWYLGKLF